MRLREIKLFEGGNALAAAGVGRIERKFIPHVIEYVAHLSGIPKSDLHPLGSTGKTPDSGDIDIGIDSGKYMPDQIHQRMSTRLGPDKHYYSHGTKIHSYAVPIVKKVGQEYVEVGGTVQVDFIFTPRVDWAKFSYHSEGTSGAQTSYKGAVRTILLKSVAASIEEKGIDMSVTDPSSGELIIRVGRTFDLSNGLRRIFQLRPERKKGVGGPYVGSMKTVHTIEELQPALDALKKRYPGQFDSIRLDVKDHEIVIHEPEKVLRMMFPGAPVTAREVSTAEGILELISKRFIPEQQVKIFTKAKDALEALGGSMRVPDIDAFIEHAKEKM